MVRHFLLMVFCVGLWPIYSSAQTYSDTIRAKNLITLGHCYGMIRHFYPRKSLANFNNWECVLAKTADEVLTIENETQALEIIHKRLSVYCPELYIKHGSEEFGYPVRLLVDFDSVLVKENYGWGDRGENKTRIEFLYHSDVKTYHKNDLPSIYPQLDYSFEKKIFNDLVIGVPLTVPARRTNYSSTNDDKLDCKNSFSDLQVQIGTIIEFCTVMEHFYPYLEEQQINSDSIKLAFLLKVLNGVTKAEFFPLLEELCTQYKDGHCAVMPYTSFNLWPDYVPNIRLTTAEDKTLISYVGEGIETLSVGDEVLKINNISIQNFIQNKINRTSGASMRWRNFMAHKELLVGEEGSTLTITTIDDEKKVQDHRLTRTLKLFKVEAVINQTVYTNLGNGNHYINLAIVSDSILDAFIEDSLSTAKGLILDVRGYPRAKSSKRLLGFLTADTLYSQPWFVQNYIYPYQDAKNVMLDSLTKWVIQPETPRFTGKVIFLIDGRVISGAESYMSIVDHYHLGTIIGEASAGTNGNVNSFQTYGQYIFWFTGMKVLKYDHSTFHGIGISPSEEVHIKSSDVKEGRDPYLMRAVEMLE